MTLLTRNLCRRYSLLTFLLLCVVGASSAQQSFDRDNHNAILNQAPIVTAMSDQKPPAHGPDMLPSDPSADNRADVAPHDSDDEPMVYVTPRDYATWARNERDRRIAEGADPDSVILQSEVHKYVPRRADESPAEFARRYSETVNAMIGRGVSILNDQCTADMVASEFSIGDGRIFDLGPESGATKGEYREFTEWLEGVWEDGLVGEVPEKWLKFEKPVEGKPDL